MISNEIIADSKWEKIIEEGTGRFLINPNIPIEKSVEIIEKREEYRTSVSWHIPNRDLIECLLRFGPIISVGSGYAYTESIAKSSGCDIIATDLSDPENNGWCRDGKNQMDVIKMSAKEAINLYPERNVFMAWPPYDNPMAYEAVKSIKEGNFLIYIGEGGGGCTGDDDFFEYLYDNFKIVEEIDIKSWSGIYDNCTIYIKNGDKK